MSNNYVQARGLDDAVYYVNGLQKPESESIGKTLTSSITQLPFFGAISGGMYTAGKALQRDVANAGKKMGLDGAKAVFKDAWELKNFANVGAGDKATSLKAAATDFELVRILKEKNSVSKSLESTLKAAQDLGDAKLIENVNALMEKNNAIFTHAQELLEKGKLDDAALKELGELRKTSTEVFDTTKTLSKKMGKAASKSGSVADDVIKAGDDVFKAVGTTSSKGIFSKMGAWIANAAGSLPFANTIKAGASALATKFPNTVGKVPELLSKAGGACKAGGAGVMAVFEGVFELVGEVAPAFANGGFGSGMKQIFKSGAKVGASVGGWIAGEAAGKAIGAAIGTAICPGLGTLIGGLIGGVVVGFIGSSVAGKVAKKITGPSEREKLEQQQVEQMSNEIYQNGQVAQLNQAVSQRVNEEVQVNGKLSEEGEKMQGYLASNQTANYAAYTNMSGTGATTATASTGVDLTNPNRYVVPDKVLQARVSTTDYASKYGLENPYANYYNQGTTADSTQLPANYNYVEQIKQAG